MTDRFTLKGETPTQLERMERKLDYIIAALDVILGPDSDEPEDEDEEQQTYALDGTPNGKPRDPNSPL